MKQKVFLALWPDNQLREQINRLAISLDAGGKPVPVANYHITLAFIGFVDQTRLHCIKNIAENVNSKPFELMIDKIGYFKNKVLWLGCKQVADELIQLQQKLEIELQRHCNYQSSNRVYMPHITLQRETIKPIPTELEKPMIWPVNSFSLIQSEQGESTPIYSELAFWKLKP